MKTSVTHSCEKYCTADWLFVRSISGLVEGKIINRMSCDEQVFGRVETKTVFSIFAKSENEQTFAKFRFAKIFVSQEVFAKMGTFLR
jgi:hypothetical protein